MLRLCVCGSFINSRDVQVFLVQKNVRRHAEQAQYEHRQHLVAGWTRRTTGQWSTSELAAIIRLHNKQKPSNDTNEHVTPWLERFCVSRC